MSNEPVEEVPGRMDTKSGEPTLNAAELAALSATRYARRKARIMANPLLSDAQKAALLDPTPCNTAATATQWGISKHRVSLLRTGARKPNTRWPHPARMPRPDGVGKVIAGVPDYTLHAGLLHEIGWQFRREQWNTTRRVFTPATPRLHGRPRGVQTRRASRTG